MSNILDYIRWRGDLPLSVVPFGEVDGLILAQLSMLRWENSLGACESGTLKSLYPVMNQKPVSVGFTAENDAKYLALLAESVRFGELEIGNFEHAYDETADMQFAAITVKLPNGEQFVSYRGTDSTLVGWKEDCRMAFSKPVPAQLAAAEYLEHIANSCEDALRVGGHSKGGNLAMYASAAVSPNVRDRVIAIYNNDGPGLSDRMNAGDLYVRIAGKLHSFVPQGSIVGMLLDHPDEFTVVKSNSVSVLQHDPYSWQVEGPRFVYMPGLSKDSARFDAAFRQWLSGMEEEDRELLVETLFNILQATNARTFGQEFFASLARNPKAMWDAIVGVDPETRKRITKMLTDLGALALKPQPELQ